jgi:outer membrane protein assembly factor BamB
VDGTPFCAILDAEGRVKRRIALLPETRVVNRGPTGSLGPGRGRWIVLRMFYGEGAYQGRFPVVAAFDGKTGEQLWVRDHYSRYGANPAIFAAHLPTAVLDYDGDGADDWMVCSENFYGIISVRDNRDLVPPAMLSDTIPGHWTAYSYPSLADLRGDGRRDVLHHSAYALALVTDLAGQPLWHHGMTRGTGGAWGLAADVDGDGRQEVLHVQPNGTIRCFAPGATEAKCPSCPPDAPLSAVNRAGRQRWEMAIGRPVSRLAGADVDGDGRHEALFGGSDGKLYALGERDGRPRVLWSVPFGRRVGEPVIADVDGDGQAEILVTVEDGRLYCLKGRP